MSAVKLLEARVQFGLQPMAQMSPRTEGKRKRPRKRPRVATTRANRRRLRKNHGSMTGPRTERKGGGRREGGKEGGGGGGKEVERGEKKGNWT